MNFNIVENSFCKCISIVEGEQEKGEEKEVEEKLIKEYFCDSECYKKFLGVAKKIKTGALDMSKVNFNEYHNTNNIISNIATYYYNLGLNTKAEK